MNKIKKKFYDKKNITILILSVLFLIALGTNNPLADVESIKEKEAKILNLEATVDTLSSELEKNQLQLKVTELSLKDAKKQIEGLSSDLEKAQTHIASTTSQNATSTKKTTTTSSVSGNSAEQLMVWIPKTGRKYHSRAGCSNMKDPSQVTLEIALSLEYGKCSKCW